MSLLLGQRALGGAASAPVARRRAIIARFANDNGATGAKAKIQFTLPHRVEFGQEVAVVGEVDALGKWDATAAVPMIWTDGDVWTATAEVPVGSAVEYKYIIRAPDSGEILEWQPCGNLKLELPAAAAAGPVVVKDAWEGELHELIIGEGAPAPAPAPAAPATEAAAPAPAAKPEAAKPTAAAEEAPAAAAATAAPTPGPTPVGGKSPIVAAGATEEVPAAAPAPKSTSTSKSASASAAPAPEGPKRWPAGGRAAAPKTPKKGSA